MCSLQTRIIKYTLFYPAILLIYAPLAFSEPVKPGLYNKHYTFCRTFSKLSLHLASYRDQGYNQKKSIKYVKYKISRKRNPASAKILKVLVDSFSISVFENRNMSLSDAAYIGHGFCMLTTLKTPTNLQIKSYITKGINCAKTYKAYSKKVLGCVTRKLNIMLKNLPNPT